MATTTISLTTDAYRKLKKVKREGESFSDVVERLTAGIGIEDMRGVLRQESAEALESAVERRRDQHSDDREKRRSDLAIDES